MVREPLHWCLQVGERSSKNQVDRRLRRALLGPADEQWIPPAWLLPHQPDAAKRVAGSLEMFGGALLCDAVGLGKTYTGLAVATRYEAVVVSAPAILVPQWRHVSGQLGVPITIVSHESLSRRSALPRADLMIVDEAHWFRNPRTVRYDTLARQTRAAHLLLMTATPVVNRPRDLLNLLRLFASDHVFAAYGIRSLTEAVVRRGGPSPAAGITPVIIARSPDTAGVHPQLIPRQTDRPVLTPAPIDEDILERVTQTIGRLQFPSFENSTAAALLRLHLFHRLASSVPACIESLQRHCTYLNHAIDAGRRGTKLSRRVSRKLFTFEDESQLEFELLQRHATSVPTADLECERRRITELLSALGNKPTSPKISALHRLLIQRGESGPSHKTIVFTSAVSTALAIAAQLRWDRTAIVTGLGARIASGPLPVSVVLSWFAPRALDKTPPPAHARIDVLVATDMASEGLNLQDADAVVHFDLPWNPLRLQQRIGRVARLGSEHSDVEIWWFAPPPLLEQHLQMRNRILHKLEHQRDLAVPVTSRVGRARVLGRSLEIRERVGGSLERLPAEPPRHCVVVGPNAAAFAVRWQCGTRSAPHLIAVAGDPPEVITNLYEVCGVLSDLLDSRLSSRQPDTRLQETLAIALRQRLANATAGPVDTETRRLTRMVLRRATRAGKARRMQELDLLDDVLDTLSRGTRRGAHLDLVNALRGKRSLVDRLRRWTHRWHGLDSDAPAVALEAAIFGDGSRE